MKKKVLYFGTLLLAALVFTVCNGRDPEPEPEPIPNLITPTEITITNEENSDIAIVKAFTMNREVTSAEYKDGSCKLNLPATLPNEYLYWASSIAIFTGCEISDKESKLCRIDEFVAYNNVGKRIGEINLENSMNSRYYYVDRDFAVKGVEWFCSFKKGWNIVYYYDGKYTTKEPTKISSWWSFRRDPLSPSEQARVDGEKAGVELCDCLQNKSEQTCLSELNSNYWNYVNSSEFLQAINENYCGWVIYTVVKSSLKSASVFVAD